MATAEKSHAVEFRLLHTKGDLERIRRAVERNPYHRILKNGRIYYKEGEDIMARRLDPPDSPPQTCATLAYMLTAAGRAKGSLSPRQNHGGPHPCRRRPRAGKRRGVRHLLTMPLRELH